MPAEGPTAQHTTAFPTAKKGRPLRTREIRIMAGRVECEPPSARACGRLLVIASSPERT